MKYNISEILKKESHPIIDLGGFLFYGLFHNNTSHFLSVFLDIYIII